MAASRYVLDFGVANAGGAPTFASGFFKRLDTLADIAAPTIVEIASGEYYFDYDWALAPSGVDTITFKVILGGVELSDVISSVAAPGTPVPGASTGAYAGYATVGELIARAAVRCGLLSLNSAQIAAYDPFSSTDQNINLLMEILRSVGNDLSARLKAGLYKTGTITTAAGATTYLVPDDLTEMVDQTAWNASNPLSGSITPQQAAYLKAWTSGVAISIPFQFRARNIVFPVAPADGLTITYEYVSNCWVRSVGSAYGDKASPTAYTDTVLFDDELVILALRLRWRELKGMDTTSDQAKYLEQLEGVKSALTGAQVLSLDGRGYGPYFVDNHNYPITPWGLP